MKVQRSDADARDRIRIVTFKVDDKFINVDQIYQEKDLADKPNIYTFFTSLMRDMECIYILYDCHYETKETKKEDLVFVMWAHDKASIKLRMKYASSKLYLKKVLDAKHEMELHDAEEYSPSNFAEQLGKNIISLEQHKF